MCHDWERCLCQQQVTCLHGGASNVFITSPPFHMLAERQRGFTLGHTSLITPRNITLQRINSNKPSSQSFICTHSIMNHRPQKKHGLRRHGSAEAIYSTWGVICRGRATGGATAAHPGNRRGRWRTTTPRDEGWGKKSNLFRGMSWGAIRCGSASHPARRIHGNRRGRL